MWIEIWIHKLTWEQIKRMTEFIVNRAPQDGEWGKSCKEKQSIGPYGTDLEDDVFIQLEEAYNKYPGGVFVYEESKVIYT